MAKVDIESNALISSKELMECTECDLGTVGFRLRKHHNVEFTGSVSITQTKRIHNKYYSNIFNPLWTVTG